MCFGGGGMESGRGKAERPVGEEREGKRSDGPQNMGEDNGKKRANSWGRA